MATGPGLWTTFFYYFSMTMLIGSFTASRVLHQNGISPDAVAIGVLLGFLAGAGGTYFNRSVTWELSIEGQKVFINRLEQVLRSLNYEPLPHDSQSHDSQSQQAESPEPPFTVYARSGAAAAFGGRLYVQVMPEVARIMGRSSAVRRLQTLL